MHLLITNPPVLAQGVITSILPVETLTTRIRFNQVIKGLFHSETSDQDVHKSGNQALFKASF